MGKPLIDAQQRGMGESPATVVSVAGNAQKANNRSHHLDKYECASSEKIASWQYNGDFSSRLLKEVRQVELWREQMNLLTGQQLGIADLKLNGTMVADLLFRLCSEA